MGRWGHEPGRGGSHLEGKTTNKALLAQVPEDAPLGSRTAQNEAHSQGNGLVEGTSQVLHVLVQSRQLVAQRAQNCGDVAQVRQGLQQCSVQRLGSNLRGRTVLGMARRLMVLLRVVVVGWPRGGSEGTARLWSQSVEGRGS